MQTKRLGSWLATAALAAVAGCASAGPAADVPMMSDRPQGLAEPVAVHADPWSYAGHDGAVLHTPHYDLYTTVTDGNIRGRLADVMEGALTQYQRVAPGVPLTDRSMLCYVFGSRPEWTEFTRKNTGVNAYLYLQINRGGYTVGDYFVAYNVGPAATLSVCVHEGWHLFAAKHFKGRLPPFLEEGIATMFEDIQYENNLPRWNLLMNRSRAEALRRAVDGGTLFPLGELMQLHAGNVVTQSGSRIEAFYAQDWAFATFLWSAEGGRYRAALRQMISDTADGTVFDPTGVLQDNRLPWSAVGVKPMLEHYLGLPLEQIDAAYQKFIRKVAFEQYDAQFQPG